MWIRSGPNLHLNVCTCFPRHPVIGGGWESGKEKKKTTIVMEPEAKETMVTKEPRRITNARPTLSEAPYWASTEAGPVPGRVFHGVHPAQVSNGVKRACGVWTQVGVTEQDGR